MAPKKPEWFEIAENDKPVPTGRTKSKVNLRPIIALAVSGLIIGAGAIFADAEEEGPASAQTLPLVGTASTAGVAQSNTSSTSQKSSTPVAAVKAAPVVATAKSAGVANPASTGDRIANPMAGGNRGGDDEIGEHEGRRGEHDFRQPRHGHHEEGEHEGFERDND